MLNRPHKLIASFARASALGSLLFLGTSIAFSAQISLLSPSATPGSSVLTQVTFASQASSVSGLQLDLDYDSSAMSLFATLSNPARTSGKSLYELDLAPNKKRFLIVGLDQTMIPDGALINVLVNISLTASAGAYALTPSNVSGTDSSGNAVSVNSTGGMIAVDAGPATPLQLSGIMNAGSFLPGPVAPGELVTLIGSGIGPASSQQPNGAPSSPVLGGTSVLFDGTAAPLLYAASNQINAIVPYSLSGKTTTLTVTSQAQTIAAVAEPVAAAAPAIFTLDSSGTGAGAILNQDTTVNSPSNPAATGSVVVIFASGAGQTSPPSVDGEVTGTVLAKPVLPVSVQIGGADAEVLYAGAAPGLIAGVVQVNALVPSGATPGPAVPIVLLVGGANSQAGVTVAIR